MSGNVMQYTCCYLDVIALIRNGKPVIGFESTTSLLRKLTRDFLFVF